jgi:hypothetical protein
MTSKTLKQDVFPNKHTSFGSSDYATTSGVLKLDIETFEKRFLSKAFFLGENKLDRVLTSLLHMIDCAGSSIEDIGDFSVLMNRKNFNRKIRVNANKSIRYRYKVESSKKDFSPMAFSIRYGIRLDTILGEYPLVFHKETSRIVLHSLKISNALFLTMKMFKKSDLSSLQRIRGRQIFLKKENLLSSLFLNIYSQFVKKNLGEKSLIKCLKNSLCLMVSKAMNQDELPEGESINLFPTEVWNQIKNSLTTEELVRFSFSCLQSKSLCQEVPEDFILDTLIGHRDQLSSPHRGLSQDTLSRLREKGRKFGKHVAKYYLANNGFFPTNKASFAFPRACGGIKGDLVFHNRLQDLPSKEDPDDRMEPFVIGLFGQPGMGKSTQINRIVSELSSLFPGVKRQNLTYQRTCHVEHWDGYHGQPIVIFDDLGQSMDGHDIKEFQTLVSCCPYVVPMASLEEKGQKFCSPIIICTSNLLYGMNLKSVYGVSNPIIDDASFWRRFHVPLLIEHQETFCLRDPPSWVREENLVFVKNKLRNSVNPIPEKFVHERFFQRSRDFDKNGTQEKWKPFTNFGSFRSLFRERRDYHENFRQNWIQTVVDKCQDTTVLDPLLKELEEFGFTESFDFKSGSGAVKCLNFPAFPPEGPLPVRVEPVPEPLKVRVITAGKGDTFCLKPLQRAMWLALGDFPQFCLTHGTNRLESAVSRIFQSSDRGDVWISGDYSAATDSFSIEGSKALLEGILESIDHEPTKRWAMKEISPHLLVYPKETGLSPVLQKSGQLMGSLLSFPLLCLLNDCTAEFSGVPSSKYLINGDDILMRTHPDNYPKWRETVQEFGLDLSPGKNYIHPIFGTVNSQLIVGETVVGSGKQTILDRRSRILGECLRDLEFAMPEDSPESVQDLFKSVNRQKLSRTVRSISVPVSHGGLSFSWGEPLRTKKSERTAKLCYLHDLFKKMEPMKDCIAIPYLSTRERNVSSLKEQERIFNEPVDLTEFHEDFLSPIDIQKIAKRCMTHSSLRELFLDQPLRSMPSLSFLHTYQIPCSDKKVKKELQVAIDLLFLSRYLQGGQEFGYDTFRREFLLTTMNLSSNTEKTVKHLVSLMDLDVRPDFLQYINLDFDPTAFDPNTFQKNLGSALKPKEFDLPKEVDDFDDFSKEIEKVFFEQCCELGLYPLGSIPILSSCSEISYSRDDSSDTLSQKGDLG